MNVSANDVSSIVQIVREVCDRWDDPRVWREHLLRRTCELLQGNVGTMFDASDSDDRRMTSLRPIAIFGMPDEIMKAMVHQSTRELSRNDLNDVQKLLPGQEKLWSEFARQGWATACTRELTDLETYHGSRIYQDLRKHADCDEFLWSVRHVDVPRRAEAIDIDRPHGAPPFGEREVTLLKILHDEITPLIGVRLTTEEHFSRDGLSKRLRETLKLLLDGKSEKQIANDLQLRPGTVHEYIATIYKHFQVSSRAELLSYFVYRAPKPRPTQS